MKTGEYITDRLVVSIIRDICAQRGFGFASLSDGWLIEISKGDKVKRVLGYKFSLNDSVSSSIAGDKVAAHLLLARAGVSNVEHALLRPKVSKEQKRPLLDWGRIVVKPLDGSGGHGIKLFDDANSAVAWIEATDYPAWAAAPFIDMEREIRIVMLDGEPLIIYGKQAVLVGGLKMFNLGMGAIPQDITPDEDLLALAKKAQQALGLRLSAVDVAETTSGERLVLEVNSGFMMEHYMRHSAENRQRGVEAYGRILEAVMR